MSEPIAPPDTDSRPLVAAGTAPHRRLTAIAEVLLCSGVPTQLIIGGLLRAAGWTAATSSGQPALPFVASLLIADTVALIALMVFLLRSHGESPRRLWLGSRPIGREILRGVALVPAIFLMVVVLLNALRILAPWLHNVPTNPFENLAGNSPADAALFGLVAILAGGVREEMQRAFLLDRFERHLGGATVGVVVLSVAFGLGHILQGLDAVITTGILGAVWALIYLRRRSSVAPLVSHAGFNSLEVLRVALVGN